MSKFKEWEGFQFGGWEKEINVRNFIQLNYSAYEGDDSFLADATQATKDLWTEIMRLTSLERENGGVLDADSNVISSIISHGAGYINKDLEQVVGVQTEKPFKRALMPYGGIRLAVKANEEYGFDVSDRVKDIFSNYRKTHNEGVYDAYTEEMRQAKRTGVITGLPDTYARGRVIGDYRRVALYGIDFLIQEKEASKHIIGKTMTPEVIRLREEVSEQVKSLQQMKIMAKEYGFDISKPAKNAKEAFQWVYFGYLSAIKEQNGAAMSVGRVETFLDCYIERDMKAGILTEVEAQELVDHFVMKLRIVKFMRPGAYNELFSGDPVWATLVLGGQGVDGRTLVSKTTFRFIHTLSNMGPAPEPNLTILWTSSLPKGFKKFCAKYSILFSSMQYESDDIMRVTHGDDYAIACCVSPMKVGKQMQFFGARCNLPKALLLAINEGHDEISGARIGPKLPEVKGPYLDYDEVMENYKIVLVWLAELYVNTLNVIHYMHDKYYYEAAEMALHDLHVHRFFATGIAGLSVAADALSAIKSAKVKPIRNEQGITVDFEVEGEFNKYGNDKDDVDEIATWLVKFFMNEIRKQYHYRNSEPTMSVLTITSNVVYGKKTGATPDGRKSKEPFAPGANPMHGRDSSGAVASLASVAKIPFQHAADGISNTFSIIPKALGKDDELEIVNLDYSGIVDIKE